MVSSGIITMAIHAEDPPPAAEIVELPESSIDQEHSFVVRGENGKLRAAISSIAGQMSKELSSLLGEKKKSSDERTLVVTMYEHGNASKDLKVKPMVNTVDGAISIGLMVDARGKIDRSALVHGLLDAMLYERGLRDKKKLEDDDQVNVPAWLSHGLIEAIAWKKDSDRRRIYEYLMEHPEIFPVDSLFRVSGREFREMETNKQEFFRASACALVLAMLKQDGGEAGMRGFLSDVVLFEGEMDDLLQKHFPNMNSGHKALQKMWSLQLAQMATPKVIETLTIKDTDQRLSKALFLVKKGADDRSEMIPILEFKKLKDATKEERIYACDTLRADLIQLSYRCYPLYRPLLLEYANITEDFVLGEMDKVATRLQSLQAERDMMLIADERCQDYLDWYQISRAHSVTGDFSGYMRLKEKLAVEREQRKDEVLDAYMDKIQGLMGGDAEEDSE